MRRTHSNLLVFIYTKNATRVYGELPFNLKGIVPTIENDMQKKAFEKGQLITKEEFLK